MEDWLREGDVKAKSPLSSFSLNCCASTLVSSITVVSSSLPPRRPPFPSILTTPTTGFTVVNA